MSEREQKSSGEGLDVRTLILAAISSAAAAVIVSRFWEGGTVISAALTPVFVTLIKEALDRPTAKLTEATQRQREQATIPEAAGAAAPDPYEEHQVPDQGGALDSEAGVRVYGRRQPRFGKIHPRVAIITGLIAFLIAAVVLTVPELIAGASLTGDKGTTLFQGRHSTKRKQDNTQTETQPQQTVTQEQTTTQEQTQTETVPPDTTTLPQPGSTQPAPAPKQAPPADSGGQTAPTAPPATP